jgi:hypothetical protein
MTGLLLQHGADPNRRYSMGNTPLNTHAKVLRKLHTYSHFVSYERIDEVLETIDLLLAAGGQLGEPVYPSPLLKRDDLEENLHFVLRKAQAFQWSEDHITEILGAAGVPLHLIAAAIEADSEPDSWPDSEPDSWPDSETDSSSTPGS